MSNMSYCRFTNTRSDLQDCLNALQDDQRLSDFEARAGKNMFLDMLEFCQEQDIIDAFDKEAIAALFAAREERRFDEE